MRRIFSLNGAAVSLLVVALGCAGASSQPIRQYAADGTLPLPPVLLVYDFAVNSQDALADTFGQEFTPEPEPPSKQVQEGRVVATALAEAAVAKLRERGIHAERAVRSTPIPQHALVVKGQFLTIERGSRVKRMIIGFGAGMTELRVRGQVYQMTETGLTRISEGEGRSHGDRMPGMAVPVGVGAAAGRVVTSAVISGGLNIAQEISGELHSDVDRLAEQFAERAEDFYRRQGWR